MQGNTHSPARSSAPAHFQPRKAGDLPVILHLHSRSDGVLAEYPTVPHLLAHSSVVRPTPDRGRRPLEPGLSLRRARQTLPPQTPVSQAHPSHSPTSLQTRDQPTLNPDHATTPHAPQTCNRLFPIVSVAVALGPYAWALIVASGPYMVALGILTRCMSALCGDRCALSVGSNA
jgi:hypothetical protein